MVVSRKNPGPAVASRTNSAQGAARRPKNAAVEPSSPQPQRVASTSGSPASSKVHRSPSSHTPKATSRKTTRWTDRVFLYGLLSFVLYAASICTPHSHKGTPYDAQPLTCRALVTYRSAILEPYVVPAVSFTYSHTLGHPAVQTHVQPYTAQIKEHARPVLGALETAYEKGVKPTIHVVHGTLYKGYIQPWYQTAFLPRWNKHVAPRLLSGWQNGVQAPLQPYIDIAKQYARHAQVYLHTHGIHRVKDALQPLYLHLQSAYISAKPTILNLYAQAKPMLLTIWSAIRQAAESLWVHGRPYACQAWKTARVYLGFALKEGVQARRTYVDPHVHKILERVSVSGGNGAVATSTRGVPDEAVNRVEEEEEEVVFVVKKDDETLPSAEEPTPTGAAAEETIEIPVTPSPTAIVEEDAATPPAASPLEHAEEETLLVPPPSTPSATPSPATPVDSSSEIEETLRSAVTFANPDPSAPVKDDARNVIEELQAANEQDVERLIKEAADFAVEELLQSPVAPTAAASTASPNPTSTTETVKETDSTPTSTPAAVADDDEFDDFLNELGIEPSEPEENGHIHTSSEHLTESAQALQDAFSSSNAEPEKVEEPRELTEEEKLEKAKEETARKRADILRRHHAWQQQLDDLVKSQKQSVVDNVDAVRLWAASELGDEYLVGGERDFTGVEGVKYRKVERTDGEQEQGLGKRMLGGVEREGGRLLRGLETYLSKAQTRSASWKRDESGETEQEKARKTAVLDGEKKKWEEVVGKVEEKFATIVRGVQGEVHEWYKGMRGREHDLVRPFMCHSDLPSPLSDDVFIDRRLRLRLP